MGAEVHIICRTEVAPGFELAGLQVEAVSTAEEGMRVLEELAGRPGAGVLLVQDDVYGALSPEALHELSRRPLPMVVPFPGPVWEGRLEGAEAYIVELLRQAIGYRVRLR
jgi:vacuolar-type H+-ATPase subunit F/Vma7